MIHDDYFSGSYDAKNSTHHHQSYSNYTLKTSVIIRVTPFDNHFVSWGILAAGFFVFSVLAFWQVIRERKILEAAANPDEDVEHGPGHDGETRSTAEITRCIVSSTQVGGGIIIIITYEGISLSHACDFTVSKNDTPGHARQVNHDTRSNLVRSHVVAVCGGYVTRNDVRFGVVTHGNVLCATSGSCGRTGNQYQTGDRYTSYGKPDSQVASLYFRLISWNVC